MPHKFHGPFFEPQEDVGWFYHDFLRLLHTLSFQFTWPAFSKDEKRLEWPDKWFDRKFDQAVRKYQDCFWKLDTCARHFSRCEEAIRRCRPEGKRELSVGAEFSAAFNDIPIYLDAMLSYLRIEADCIANIIPNLYGKQGKKQSIARDSFRAQVAWFTKKRRDFDPQYTSILDSDVEWFRMLAGERRGEGEGLRDTTFHYRGTYQLGWAIPEIGEELQVSAGLVSDSGYVDPDVIQSLKSIVADYFLYLDRIYEHFGERLRSEVGEGLYPIPERGRRWLRVRKGQESSLWLYPTIQAESV